MHHSLHIMLFNRTLSFMVRCRPLNAFHFGDVSFPLKKKITQTLVTIFKVAADDKAVQFCFLHKFNFEQPLLLNYHFKEKIMWIRYSLQ